MKLDLVLSGLMGVCVGDALGVPVEFSSRKERLQYPVTAMQGYGTYYQPPGTWSDDSSLTFCLAEAICQEGVSENLLNAIARNFCRWYDEDDVFWTPRGILFDIGATTDEGFFNENFASCFLLSTVGFFRINRVSSSSLLPDSRSSTIANRHGTIVDLTIDEIESNGYVIDTLEASLWCFLNSCSYADAVLKAVNLGGDTDTTAAVTGGLAGIYYGIDDIPSDWFDRIARKDDIVDLADRWEKSLQSLNRSG